MTYQQLQNAVPDTFKCCSFSRHYEFCCRQCSFKEVYGYSKRKVRSSAWQDGWQLQLSDMLEAHQQWHQDNPGKSWEEHRKEVMQKASDDAMRMLNKLFRFSK